MGAILAKPKNRLMPKSVARPLATQKHGHEQLDGCGLADFVNDDHIERLKLGVLIEIALTGFVASKTKNVGVPNVEGPKR